MLVELWLGSRAIRPQLPFLWLVDRVTILLRLGPSLCG